jgi:hypothetical protein
MTTIILVTGDRLRITEEASLVASALARPHSPSRTFTQADGGAVYVVLEHVAAVFEGDDQLAEPERRPAIHAPARKAVAA